MQCNVLKFYQHRTRDMERKRMVKSMGPNIIQVYPRDWDRQENVLCGNDCRNELSFVLFLSRFGMVM